MGFTTQTFLFLFFPACVLGYAALLLCQRLGRFGEWVTRARLTDVLLVVFSLGFYAWACFDHVFLFAAYILLVWLLGRGIAKRRDRGISRWLAVVGIAVVTALLLYVKYTGFFLDALNGLFGSSLRGHSLIAPLGISFITFSAVSYLADIRSGKAEAGSLLDCALYLSFFPKVVSGPIALWRDFAPQIRGRKATLVCSTESVNRIMIGFAKKVILADSFGAALASINPYMDTPTAWGAAFLYMLQIYFDFSGYSDIAIGLAGLFGFEIKENFRFPYLSQSIAEFWRRWHISLGTWFREYIYFPLGGSRRGRVRTVLNLAAVFALTGIWHGAGWTYILWGAINGIWNIGEHLLKDKKVYQKTPAVIKWGVTMLVTLFAWQIFRLPSLHDAARLFETMFGLYRPETVPFGFAYYFDAKLVTLMVIGALGSTVLGLPRVTAFGKRLTATPVGATGQAILYLLLFVLAIIFMVNSTYSPFLYFQY